MLLKIIAGILHFYGWGKEICPVSGGILTGSKES